MSLSQQELSQAATYFKKHVKTRHATKAAFAVISRASESVMFGEPSYRFEKKLIRGGTALDQVSSESMPFWGAGSTEPRQ